jgi:hypothetical protein
MPSKTAAASIWRLTFANLFVARVGCSIEHARLVAAMIQPQLGLIPPDQAIEVLCGDPSLLQAIRQRVG